MRQDISFALRLWRRNPAFAAIALAAMALGIGASTAIFSVVHAVLLVPLPYRDPGQLVSLAEKHLSSPGLDRISAAAARDLGAVPFISAQNHWSLLARAAELDVVPAALQYGLGVLPYFPLANGLLTGKVRRDTPPAAGTRLAGREDYVTEAKLDKVEALADWAQQRGLSILEVAIGGLAALPGCTSVIAGATSAEQVRANAAAGEWVPAADEMAEIDKIVPVLG